MTKPLVTSPWVRTAVLASSIALATALSGCGGEKSASVTLPPPPPPPPEPPVEVLPFPSASAPTTYDANHITAAVRVTRQDLPGDTAKITGITELTDVYEPNPHSMTITYNGPNRYSLDYNGFGGPSFEPEARTGGGGRFTVYRNKIVDGYVENLNLARKGVGITLTYATFGMAETLNPNSLTADGAITFFTAGSRTPSAQMPTTGTATLRGIADGLWVDGAVVRRLYGSTAKLDVDFARGEVISTLELRGHGDPFGDFGAAPTKLLGTFTGIGALSNESYFAGSYALTGGYGGRFRGHFYGPAAQEYGLVFKLAGGPDQNVFGVAVGKRR